MVSHLDGASRAARAQCVGLSAATAGCPPGGAVAERERRQHIAEEALGERMMAVVNLVNSKKAHLPPVNLNTSAPMVFPFEVHP